MTWPEEVFPAADAPLVIGIVGPDPFEAFIDQVAAEAKAQNRDVEIRRFASARDLSPCHILFISSSKNSNRRKILAHLNHDPVLTVGETDDFAGAGGMVQFMIKDDMVRFRVNLDTVERADLKMSSKFLKLVQIVRNKRTEENR